MKRHFGYYRKKKIQTWIVNLVRRLEIQFLCHSGLIKKLTLPDFLIIGVPKAGTWWLASNLSAHPQIYLAMGETRGELHYFDTGFHRSIIHYASYFQATEKRVTGEKTPNYCVLSKERVQLVQTLLPDVKLLLMLRDPVERLWSEAMMMLVRKPKISYQDLDKSLLWKWLEGNRDRVLYSQIFERWEAIYPSEQLYTGFLEDVKNSPQELLFDVFGHIGVQTDVDWRELPYNKVANQGPGVQIPDSYAEILRDWYTQEIDWLHGRFGSKIAGWL